MSDERFVVQPEPTRWRVVGPDGEVQARHLTRDEAQQYADVRNAADDFCRYCATTPTKWCEASHPDDIYRDR